MKRLRLTVLLMVSALAGCSVLGSGTGAAMSTPTAASSPLQCVPEGQSCANKSATCCAGLTCTGIGKSICLVAY
jgi:hypothetical protein